MMEDLTKESLDVLGKAKKEYDLTTGDISEANSILHDFNLLLKYMVDPNSAET